MISTLLTGCSNEPGSSVESDSSIESGSSVESDSPIRMCGFSDSVPEAQHKLEFDEWSKGYFYDSDAEKQITVSVGDHTVEAKYVNSEVKFYEFFNTRRYKDADNNVFELAPDGTLSRYFYGGSNDASESGPALTEAECIQAAYDFINSIVNVDDYTVKTEYLADRNMYHISFVKYVNGFKTADQADISIKETGQIYSFSSTMLGRIPTNADVHFDLDKIREQIISKLDKEYAEAKKVYDSVSYEIPDYTLTMNEAGEYFLVYSVNVKCVTCYDEYETILAERILLLI
ncbi:MAG: hypothetical protein ACI3XR_07880 [Eubacteriales bacterium]